MWMGNPILDSKGDIKGLTVLHAVTEGVGMAEWHGLIKATVYAVNPLSLHHPDNTNTGSQDFSIPAFLPQEQQQAMFMHLVNNTNYDPELMAAYIESATNICDLLSVELENVHNYWLMGFSVMDLYHEGESPTECWERLRENYGVLDFLVDSIANGELQEGMLNSIERAEVELPEQKKRYTPQMKRILVSQIHALKVEWGANMRLNIDRICEEGLIHKCIKRDESTPVQRGRYTPSELYLPRLDEWLGTSPEIIVSGQQKQPVVNQRSAENYRRLIEVFKGDGYSIAPMVNRYGDIVLQWRTGPNKMGEAILSGDGAMHLDLDYINPVVVASPKFVEIQAQVEFNENDLSTFIETGNLPD